MKRGLFLLSLLSLLLTGSIYAQETETKPEVTIVKYSDYQCPACKAYFNFEKQLKEDFGDQVEIETKHFPLSMHQHAQLASRAAEAARKQGKYEEMHAMIFEGQEQWARSQNPETLFIGYAKNLDLNIEEFRQDLNSAEMQRIVMADRREGLNLDVNATPTFFINGQKLERNPGNYTQFKAIIQSFLDQ